MAIYSFKAYDKNSKKRNVKVDADSRSEAVQIAKSRGFIPYKDADKHVNQNVGIVSRIVVAFATSMSEVAFVLSVIVLIFGLIRIFIYSGASEDISITFFGLLSAVACSIGYTVVLACATIINKAKK